MTKSELIEALAKKQPHLTLTDVDLAVNRAFLPESSIITSSPLLPIWRSYSREEPSALAAQARICAGCALQAHEIL